MVRFFKEEGREGYIKSKIWFLVEEGWENMCKVLWFVGFIGFWDVGEGN